MLYYWIRATFAVRPVLVSIACSRLRDSGGKSQVVRVLISLLIRSHYVYYLRAWHMLSFHSLITNKAEGSWRECPFNAICRFPACSEKPSLEKHFAFELLPYWDLCDLFSRVSSNIRLNILNFLTLDDNQRTTRSDTSSGLFSPSSISFNDNAIVRNFYPKKFHSSKLFQRFAANLKWICIYDYV